MTRTIRFWVIALSLAALAAGCVEKTTELTAAERQELEPFVSRQAPRPQHALEVSFEDKLELIGYDVSAQNWQPGEQLTVTWYWKVNKALEEGWNLFTHVADASGANRLNQDGSGVVRRLYPPGRWKTGEYIKDRQEVTLPADWSSSQAVFYLGVWNGPHRLHVTRGPNDGDDRVRALTVTTTGAAATPPQPAVPTLRASKAAEAPRIDGRLDETAWTQTPATTAFVNTMSGAAAEPRATAKVLWDDNNLYVGFDVADDYLKSTFRNRDDHLWEQDAVEIFVDPEGDGRNYFEMQVSPQGVVFDTRYDARRQPQPIGNADWNSELRAQVQRRGTANDDDADQGYTVEIAIPWAAFNAGTPPATKPSANQTWRINFYVMDAREEGQRAVAWSPPRVGDFHVPDRFGRVVFFDPAAPQPQPTAAEPMAPLPIDPGRIALPPSLVEQLKKRANGAHGLTDGRGDDQPRPGEPVPTRDNPNPAYPTDRPSATSMQPRPAPTTTTTTRAAPAPTTATSSTSMQ